MDAFETTTGYAFRPPTLVPGYTGFVPQVRFGYGDTFGCTTTQYFHTQRHHLMSTSTRPCAQEHAQGGKKTFPTVYSNDPAHVLASRKRCRERRLTNQRHRRTIEGTAEDNLDTYSQDCQRHREHYIDQTGTVQRVEMFVLPKLTADTRSNQNFITTRKMRREEPQVKMKRITPQYLLHHNIISNKKDVKGGIRERAIRDQFFEDR